MDEGEEIERLRKELRHWRSIIVMLVVILVAFVPFFFASALGVLRIGNAAYSLDLLSGDDIFLIVCAVEIALEITYVAVKYRRLCRKIMLLEQRHREEGGSTDDRDG